MLKGIVIGAWLMTIVAGLCYLSYKLGDSDAEARVVYSCNYYGKYAFDGTQTLLCSAIISPNDLGGPPKDYVPYTKAEKDSTRKMRK